MNGHLKRVLILLLIFTFVFQMAGLTSLERIQAYAEDEVIDVSEADQTEEMITEEIDTGSPGEIETEGEEPPGAAEEPAEPEAASEETAEASEETAAGEETVTVETPAEEPTDEPAEDEAPALKAAGATKANSSDTAVLAFTSDTHNKSGNEAANRLSGWLDLVIGKYGKVDVMAFGGDMAGAGASGYWDLTQADMDVVSSKTGVTGIYTTGNHEISMGGDFSYTSYKNGSYSSTETKGQFELDMEMADEDLYRVYCLGSRSSSQSYPEEQRTALSNYLNSVGNDKPIFIITHFPLHYYSSRTTSNASDVIDLLNTAVEENGQTIIFLWGHNHTMSDTYYDQIYGPDGDDSIQYSSSSNSKKTIKFYYGGAGCMSDSENGTGSAYVKGKGLVATITKNSSNSTISFAYYDASGNDVTESKSIKSVNVDISDPITPTGVTINEATGDDGQPVTTSVAAGKTLQLHLTLEPAGASSSGITWSSSDETIATVSKGLVTAKKEGTAIITAAVPSGAKAAGSTSNIEITVTAAPKEVSITPTSGNNSPSVDATIDVGETLTINVTNGSSNAAYNFTATLSNSSVAEIEGNATVNIAAGATGQFTVTGLTEGTVDITIQSDGTYSTRKGTIHLTVNSSGGGGDDPTPDEGTTYYLADTLEADGEYIIASGSTGTVYVVSNTSTGSGTSTGLVGISANVVDDSITLSASDAAKATFTAELKTSNSGSVSAWLNHGGKYLYTASSGGLRISDEQTSSGNTGKFWHYKADGKNLLWYFKDTSSSDGYTDTSSTYRYYLNVNSGTFTSDHVGNGTSLSNTDTPAIYLFKRATEKIDVTGVTVSPTSAIVKVDKTVQLTATIDPANATNKDVTWSTSDPSIATIDDSGKVTGKAVGTATITVTTADGGKTATCVVTVEESSGPEYYVINIGNYIMSCNLEDDRMTNTSGYEYYGLQTVTYDANAAAPYNTLWLLEETDTANGYYIKSASGKYLSATYVRNSSSSGYTGTLTIGDTKDIWIATSGIDTWELSGSTLKSSNASANANNNKEMFLAINAGDGGTDFFSIRSENNAGTSQLIEPEEIAQPVAVTGVTVDPTSAVLKVGKTQQLTATVAPEGADNKAVTWSSNAEEVATVDENGRVTAVAEGTANITVTTADGGKTATCAVTVEPSTDSRYELVSELADGGEYLIVSANSGSAYALKNPGTSGTNIAKANYKTAVTVETGNYILTSEEDIVWTAEVSGSGFHLTNGGLYLEGSGGNTGVYSTLNNADRAWTYSSANQLQMPGGSNSTYTLRYRTGSNYNYFQGASGTTSSTYVVYLFKKVGTDPVSGVTLSPTTLSLEVGETSTLTATVQPSSAGNKSVIWTSSNESVATVDEGGLVTAVAAGTATITVTTVDGNKTATAEVTVVQPQPGEKYILVDALTNGKEYLIVSAGSAGSAYALKNPGGTSAGVDVQTASVVIKSGDVNGDGAADIYIETSAEDIVWTATTNSTGFDLTNEGSYFEFKSGELQIFNPQKTPTRFWEYNDGQLQVLVASSGSSSSSYYNVYYSGGTFTQAAASTSRLVYIFEKVTDTPHTHTYGEPEYTWTATDNGYTCTATAVCTGCEEGTDGHSVTETVTAAYAETTAATCTAAGSGIYTASFTNELFTQQTKDVVIPAAGHTMTHHAAVAPTCTEDGTVEYWSCSVCKKNFIDEDGTTELTSIVASALGHSWGEWTQTTAPTCTAVGEETRTCSRCDATETREVDALGHTMTHHDAVAPTCTEAGTVEYWSCSVCKKNFSDEDGTTELTSIVASALGHNWSEWTVTTPSTCTAAGEETRTCSRCDAIETREVDALGHNLTAHVAVVATCEAAGNSAYWSCDRCGKYFSDAQGTNEIAENGWVIPALGHDWNTPEYAWAADNSEVTATRTCKHDATHVETEKVNANYEVISEATETEAGLVRYTSASFQNPAFEVQTKDVSIPPTGYEVTYEWAEDFSSVTATAVPYAQGAATVTETVQTTSAVTKDPTCEETGVTTYTATFTNALFSTQTKTKDNPALGHDWEFVNFTWTENDETGYAAVANYKCKHNEQHTQTVAATMTSETTDPTCEEDGFTVYTAAVTATNSLDGTAHTDNKTVTIEATGHDWQFVNFTWTGNDEDGYTKAVANYRCKNDSEHTKTVNVTVTSKTTPATCTETGSTVYTAALAAADSPDGIAHTDTKTVVIHALGHGWEFEGFTWVESDEAGYTAVANYKCKNDEQHVQTVDATVTSVTTDPTCEGTGSTVYTAAVTAADSLDKTAHSGDKTVEISAIGHIWIEPAEWTWIGDDENGYTKVEGTFTCQNDSTHTQTVESTNITTNRVDPTPTQPGKITYSAKITGPDNVVYSIKREIIIPAAGYTYEDPVYTWKETTDGYSVTALKECNEDQYQNITETVTASYAVTKPATCEATGVGTYTASFTNSAFVTQTKTETISATGHTEVVDEAVAPTCTETGLTEGSHCSVCGTVLTAQTTVPALGHDWNDPTDVWNNDHTSVDMTFTCKNDPTHTHTETVNGSAITSEITTQPTATAPGVRTYTATVTLDGKTYTVTDTEAIPATGSTVSGSITSFVGRTEEGQVSVQLFVGDSTEAAYTATVNNNETYTFAGVAAGTYNLTVSKKDHVTRTYEITVNGTAVTQDVKIHLHGDVTGDGKLTTADVSRVNSHVRKVDLITDEYIIKCGDVIGDGDGLTTGDVSRINSHVRKISYIW